MTRAAAGAGLREVLGESGQVGRDLLAVDWEQTAVGLPESWSRSLVTMVRVLLASRFSMWMAWGPELTFFCNEAYRRDTLGRKYPWALGRPAREVWAEIWPEIGPRIEAVLGTGEATWDEALLLFLERNGYAEETYHTFSYSPLPDDDGRIAGMLCVVSEETERIIGERRLATLRDLGAVPAAAGGEREFLAAAARELAASPSALPFTLTYLFDESGDAHLGASTGIRAGHPAAPGRMALDDADQPWPVALLRSGSEATIDDLGTRFETLPTGGWELPPAQALAVPLPDSGGAHPYGFLIVGINPYRPLDSGYRSFVRLIAQRLAAGVAGSRNLEFERRRAEQLAELDRAKTAFFSNVSHEFRTPLTLMLGPLQDAAAGSGQLGPESVDLVHRNALRLLKLVSGLLDFSRVEAGRMQADFRPLDVSALTADIASMFRDATRRAGLELLVDCPPLPQPVYADPDLWERIVLNLLSNALKVTVAGRIAVAVRPLEDAVELSVSDTGPGIPGEELEHLFQRFYRVRSSAGRSHEGTGIGLALVRELVELHNGQVSVTSTIGEGSRFTVRVPVGHGSLGAEGSPEPEGTAEPTVAPLFVAEALSWNAGTADDEQLPEALDPEEVMPLVSGGRIDLAGSRVLIADDNRDLRRYLTRLLSTHFEVEAVADGVSALQVARERPPDLLITDVMMPGLDGFELLTELRSLPQTRELPVIMLSARAGEEASLEGLQSGADDYLPKPFSGRELLGRVCARLELAGLRREIAEEARSERQRLEQTLRQLPAGVILAEAPSGRTMLANAQVTEILEHPLIESATVEEYGAYRAFTLEGEPLGAEQWPLARAIRKGEVTEESELLYRTGSGRQIILRVSAAPIRDEQERIFAGVLVFQDVTERVRTQRLLAGQRDILALIARGEPLERTLDAIVVCVEALSGPGARASILLRSEDGQRLVYGSAPSLPAAYNEAIDGIAIGPAVGSCGTAAFRGETVVVRDTQADPLWADFRELAAEHGLRSCWSTPIHATDGELVGTFAIYRDQPYDPPAEDRQLVDLLARTAAVAIERSRDARARERQFQELQSSLLPRALPEVPGIQTASLFRPGDRGLSVGGDFYDLFALPDGSWGIVVGDVCGHGAPAAAVTALTRHTTRAVARLDSDPGRVLARVNDALLSSEYDRYCTAVFGRIEPHSEGARLTLACGGHPAPLIRRASGAVETLEDHGTLLGVFERAEYPRLSVDLRPGDALLLYTDGLIERNPKVSDDAGLLELVARLPGADQAEALLGQLERAALGPVEDRQRDDVAVLLVQVVAPSSA